MNFAYVTNEKLNEDQALQLADECGINLCPLSPDAAPETGWFDAVLYDWDSLPPEQQHEIPLACLAGFSCCPVAVHGYTLDREERESLHQDGIAVFRRLETKVFRTLRSLAKRQSYVLQGMATAHF
jgi:hypothetical protein